MGTSSLPATEFLDPVIQGSRSVKAAGHNGPPLFFTFKSAPLSAYFSFCLAGRGNSQLPISLMKQAQQSYQNDTIGS
jgi:hypothetical protein